METRCLFLLVGVSVSLSGAYGVKHCDFECFGLVLEVHGESCHWSLMVAACLYNHFS